MHLQYLGRFYVGFLALFVTVHRATAVADLAVKEGGLQPP